MDEEDEVAATPGGRSRFVPGLMALGGGLLIALSLPPWGWWPLAFVGLAVFDRAVAGTRAVVRFRRAWLTGVGVLAPSTFWMVAFTPPGYVIEVVGFATFLGVAVMAAPSSRWRWLALPGSWAAFEAVKGRWPFGGVPLSELAMGQIAGPLGPVARVGGVILVAVVTVVGAMALSAATHRAWRPALALLAAVLVAVGVAAVAPRGEASGPEVVVAYVQGGGEQGTVDAETDDREVFLAHYDATLQLSPGEADLIVWPENVVNVDDPIEETREGRELAQLAVDLETPILAGIVEGAGDDLFTNASVLFDVDGRITARYDKVRRVPFGEYVPLRGVLDDVAGSALPAKDAIVGRAQNTIDVTLGDDAIETRVGVVISWEVFFGDRGRDAANGDGSPARFLVNPTNGSSYTGTQVQTQQVASSRLRALETGRWVVQVAPTGFSAFVSDTGEVFERSGVSERRVEVREVPFRHGRTLFMVWGPWPPFLLAVALVVAANGADRRFRPRA
ncbi:apolipoprotein N-acyltransferase [Iamia sp. SCSIO 61187]|uniref:apolipoprotein N-acyltransferase n=1 Tax=Iamia sp. SCSIO 61187 TaxID=2722752 RepID=UPI001C636C13|nr:apolipoprotein N-acyltransferase [Iamia sp. SCSIO 61187]QYG91707.1 apolipoprotein N-acyltransferase [Iamia sp. SCSIO 61187]